MFYVILAIVFAIGGVYFWKNEVIKVKSQIVSGALDALIMTVCIASTLVATCVGIFGFGFGDSEYVLESTKELPNIIQIDESYALLDEEGNCYYVNGNRVQVVNSYGVKESGSCTLITGKCENIYVEKYDIDYKMNFWTFNLVSGKEYKIYIPEE
jgi:hypothetical protein